MKPYPVSLFVGLGLAALAGPAGVRADNPLVTLKLERATLAECAAALTKQSSVFIEVAGPAPPPGKPEPRADFHWQDAPLSRVLREMEARYGCRLSGLYPVGYRLTPLAAGEQAALPRIAFEKDGMRVAVVSVGRNNSVYTMSRAAPPVGNLFLSVAIRLTGEDGDRVAGLEKVTAVEDTGRVLPSGSARPLLGAGRGSAPDESTLTVTLTSATPGVRKLDRVEGEVLVYPRLSRRRIEIPLPLTGPVVRVLSPERTVVVASLESGATASPSARVVHSLAFRMYDRLKEGERPPGLLSEMSNPVLVGSSGRHYTLRNSIGHGIPAAEGWRCMSREGEFEPVSEAVTKLVWNWVEKPEPVSFGRFLLRDLPVPQDAPGPAGLTPATPAPLPALASPDENPYLLQGGGALLSPIELPPGREFPARLWVGLAAAQGMEWEPTTWLELPVGGAAIVRLPLLKPGRYRIVRTATYSPEGFAHRAPRDGRWLNSSRPRIKG
ncbi:MAG: hypothetical protein FJX77_12980 [Armatimonadetes bacterium]|nr:hypothetical protein [Armatimonadota bacterium]